MVIYIAKRADKILSKLDNSTRQRIVKEIKLLSNWPNVKNVKSLAGNYKGYYRLRVGNWRVLFEVDGSIINIADIFDRKDAYKGG